MRRLAIAGSFGDSISFFFCPSASSGRATPLVSIGSVEAHKFSAIFLYPAPSSGDSFQEETMLHAA